MRSFVRVPTQARNYLGVRAGYTAYSGTYQLSGYDQAGKRALDKIDCDILFSPLDVDDRIAGLASDSVNFGYRIFVEYSGKSYKTPSLNIYFEFGKRPTLSLAPQYRLNQGGNGALAL